MNNKLKVVLDTNVFLVSISSRSKYHWIFNDLVLGKYQLFITTEILMEYEEIITIKYSSFVAKKVIETLLIIPNVHKINIYFNWNLIKSDSADNKFADCAINSNSHLLVTNDKHFNVLSEIVFPQITVSNINSFKSILKNFREV